MQRSGHTNGESAQYAFWFSQGYRAMDLRGLYEDLYGLTPHIAPQYGNGTMTTKHEDHKIIEVEMVAQEIVMQYEMRYENYFLITLECLSEQPQHKLVCRIQKYGTSYEES